MNGRPAPIARGNRSTVGTSYSTKRYIASAGPVRRASSVFAFELVVMLAVSILPNRRRQRRGTSPPGPPKEVKRRRIKS